MPSTTGTRLHELIERLTGEGYTPSCGCRAVVSDMNANPPQWSLDNMPMIVGKLRQEAGRRHWWAKFTLSLPGFLTPVRWIVRDAVRLAIMDKQQGTDANGPP